MRSTASLAALIMKIWDQAWLSLAARESLSLHDYFRYVDDVRNCLQVLKEGWKWDGFEFVFSEEWEKMDFESGLSDQKRTTNELCKAMSSLVPYLQFEGEIGEMFCDQRLPTLDTSVWWDGEKFMFSFFK